MINSVHLGLAPDVFCNRIQVVNKSFVAMIAGKSLFVFFRSFHVVWHWKTHSIDNTFFGIIGTLLSKHFCNLIQNKA